MEKYLKFREEFNKSIISAKRDIEEIELIAVSKRKPARLIEDVIESGCFSFGENQLQEIEGKWDLLKSYRQRLKLHFIGGIQSKKTRNIFKSCDSIHSIDRLKVVKIIKSLEKEIDKKVEYFIQINTGDEQQKYGVPIHNSEKFIDECLNVYSLNVKGLMCLPPLKDDPKMHFMNLNKIGKNFNLPYLSMGMSHDYDIAIQCGSTHVRIGSKIFGSRD
tara:strand:+ start:199 stop:852 length:654 start_codon:yes stop_codon:yes gene_type:complete